MVNSVVLVGRITKDPEIKYTNTGIPYVQFSVAVDRGVKDANGERQADFISCVAWRQTADFMSKFIKKGHMISIQGRIQTRNYQQDNQTRYITEVLCESVSSLQPRDNNQPANNNYQQPNQGYNNSYQGGYSNQGYQNQRQNFNENQSKDTFNINDVSEDDLPF